MPNHALNGLTCAVQRNCHIADARHGADYTMCVYLMKMREYYRWEKGLGYDARLPKEDIGEWLMQREELWESLSEADFDPLEIDGELYDPFDSESVNEALLPHGFVYSGGLGKAARPHFFLGTLMRQERPGDFSILVADRELARDLASPPAMTGGRTIYVRRESLRRMLWEKLENWRWSRLDNALGRALSHYPFDADLNGALDAMTDNELDAVQWHEVGECQAAERLGERWNSMLLDLGHTPAELMARAVRDHLADCTSTLPRLVEHERLASIHFYVGNLNGMRKEVFPGLIGAYREWDQTRDGEALLAISAVGRDHWETVAREMLDLHAGLGPDAAAPIADLVRGSYL
ncbi:MAG: hypothetical protein PVF91_06700 [Chromatiales bacterium]|jgi:hypothetical protein